MRARAGCPTAVVEAHLADTVAIVGQTDLDAARIARAPALRAVVNVEGNFLRNVDYEACFARGIHVLVASPAFAPAVAEAALGMAIDLARGITRGRPRHARRHRGLRARGQPRLLPARRQRRRRRRARRPRRASSCGCWRPSAAACAPTTRGCPSCAVRAAGAEPAGLDELLRASRVVFVFAAPTTDNAAMLGRRELELLPDGAAVLVMSRAAVVDLDALVELAAAGRLRAAIDVWPREPVPADHPARSVGGPAALAASHRRDARGLPGHRRASRWPTSSSCCAACRPSPAGAPSARPSARLRSRPIDEPE